MQALMLAAGMGRRMGRYTENHTKCMVEVAGETLLEKAIEAIRMAGIQKLIIVVGYKAEKLQDYIASKHFEIAIEYVYNYNYETTNNIYSLYMAKDYLKEDDTILLESDLVFDKDIIKKVVETEGKNVAVVAKYDHWMDGTVVVLNAQKQIMDFVDKSMFCYDDIDNYYKTVNIYKFSREFSEKKYIPFLKAYLSAYGTNQYYEQVLKIFAHIRNSELTAYILNEENWYEIDDSQDLDIANTIFAKDVCKLKKYELHFGGYWRFPKLKDFCYLVNPYYPPVKMMNQIKSYVGELMLQYPSGMNIQQLNAASMFEVDEQLLLVGNGAAELINILGKILSGTVSISIPTFNEYIRCFENCKIREMEGNSVGYRYDVNYLLEEIEHTDNLVIINPDNPSGAFLSYQEIESIIKKCQEKNVTIVIDESFIDFAEKGIRYTLIKESVLQKYSCLVVIKSISKSYGIPGLRLGVMATGNNSIKKRVKEKMAVWNINSIAEYFLQIQKLYKNEYMEACDMLAEQRNVMQERLSKMNDIIPYPSQANYIMCELTGKINSRQLALRLLKDYNILIKDLSGKRGFEGKRFIRLAVKDAESNDQLLCAIENIR